METQSIEFFINENKLLNTRLSSLNQEIINLKEKLYTSTSELNNKKEENYLFDNKILKLEKIIEDYKRNEIKLNNEIDLLRNDFFKILEDDKLKQRKINSYEIDNQILNTNVNNLISENRNKVCELSNYIRENTNLNTEIIKLSDRISTMNIELEYKSLQIEKTMNDMKNLNNGFLIREEKYNLEIQSLNTDIFNLNEKINIMQGEKLLLKNEHLIQINQLEQENKKIQISSNLNNDKLSDINYQLEISNQKIHNYKISVDDYRKIINEKDVKILLLEEMLKDCQIDIKKNDLIKRYDNFIYFDNKLQSTGVLMGKDYDELKQKVFQLYLLLIEEYEKKIFPDDEIIKKDYDNLIA